MKLRTFLLCALCVSAFSTRAGDYETATAPVSLREFTIASQVFQYPKFTMEGSNAIRVGLDNVVKWHELPLALQWKLKEQRAAWLRIEAKMAAAKAAGFEWQRGRVVGRTATGFIFFNEATRTGEHILGVTSLVDGDPWSGFVRYRGTYEYTATGGAHATVREYEQR